LYDRVRLDESFPMSPCSTSGDENSLRYDLGPHHCDCPSALSRGMPTKETPETAETRVEKRLKRLWARIGQTLKRLRSTSAGRWWLVWVSGGRKWVLVSSQAINARQPECVKKIRMQLYYPLPLICRKVVHSPQHLYRFYRVIALIDVIAR
jgi:hypothetical protein